MLSGRFSKNISNIDNPEAYIKQCLNSELIKIDKILLEANGYTNMTNNYITYQNQNVKYLCKASQFYKPCINQEPMLIEMWRKKIESYMAPKTKACFENLAGSLKNNGYTIKQNNLSFEIEFTEDAIIENVKTDFAITKNEQTRNIKEFSTELKTPTYSLINTARNIINYESTLCTFNSIGWMNQLEI